MKSARESIDRIPRLEREFKCLKQAIEQSGGENIQDITSLALDASNNLTLTFLDSDGNPQTVSASLDILADDFIPDIVVDTYDDLLLVTGQQIFEFAEVRNSQGTPWLPGSIGGTYRGAGLYYWDGVQWVSDNDTIFATFQTLTNSIVTLNNNLNQEITDRTNADSALQIQITANGASITSLQSDVLALQTGKADVGHTHVKADITDFNDADYATAAQGALADTALQPGSIPSEITNNAGQIKLNWTLATEPRSTSGYTGGISNQIPLNTNYTVSSSPTTTYPYLANAGIGGENVINPITLLLREVEPGQTIVFRVKCGYFNKGAGQNGNFTIRMYNPNPASSFTVPKSVPTPDGTTEVEEEFEFIAIADALSLDPLYGYAFEAESTFNDGNLTAFISEITAFYLAKDVFNK